MRQNGIKLTILQQTYLLFGGFMLLAILNYFIIDAARNHYISFDDQITEINHFKSQPKRLLQSIESFQSGIQSNEDVTQQLATVDALIGTLKHGGKLTLSDKEISSASSALAIELEKFHEAWKNVKRDFAVILKEPARKDTTVQQAVMVQVNDSTTATEIQNQDITIDNHVYREAYQSLQMNLPILTNYFEDIESTLVSDKAKANDLLSDILFFFLAFNLVCIVGVLIIIKKNLFDPLNNLGHLIADENYTDKSDYAKDNELGLIARSFNNLVESMRRTTSFVAQIGEGKLDADFVGINEKDVRKGSLQAALLDMRAQMKKMDMEESERKWATGGLAKFVDILRASDDLQELSDEIISNLVEYTNSNQGGIYILNEDDEQSEKKIELISLYAYSHKKYETKFYRPGEGLVGQTFVEGKSIYLMDVPQDYIAIGSGLGDANPTSILLVPLKEDNAIYGVVELASFNEYKEYEIEFVETLAESIASTISGVKANQKTKQLLEESTQLTEQMQAQEEEMRQNMEELTATQEEMGRKELAVNAQLEAINRSVGLVEYSPEGEVINANRKYHEALGYDANSILSASFHEVHGNDVLLNEFKTGKSWSGWLIKKHNSGHEVEVKSFFNPIKDESGELVKIIEIISQFEKEGQATAPTEEWKELKDVEEELRQNLEELELTQEQLTKKLNLSEAVLDTLKEKVGTILFDPNGRIMNANGKANKIAGTKTNITDIFGNDLTELVKSSDEIRLKSKVGNFDDIMASARIISGIHNEANHLIIWIE